MQKIHRSYWLPIILGIYITGSYIYLAIKGQIPLGLKAILMILFSYLMLALLFYTRYKRIKKEKQQLEEWRKKMDNQ